MRDATRMVAPWLHLAMDHVLGFVGLLFFTAEDAEAEILFRALDKPKHVYGVLHRMFEDAVADQLIASNPCAIKRGELPAKIDKDPTWRSGAVFTRAEVERLISDERIPEDRRTFYAIVFLTGARAGEASALRWRCYDSAIEPLGKLVIAGSYGTKGKKEKGV